MQPWHREHFLWDDVHFQVQLPRLHNARKQSDFYDYIGMLRECESSIDAMVWRATLFCDHNALIHLELFAEAKIGIRKTPMSPGMPLDRRKIANARSEPFCRVDRQICALREVGWQPSMTVSQTPPHAPGREELSIPPAGNHPQLLLPKISICWRILAGSKKWTKSLIDRRSNALYHRYHPRCSSPVPPPAPPARTDFAFLPVKLWNIS
jgi:hypothetical protein